MINSFCTEVLDCIPSSVFIFNKNLKTLLCNKSFKNIFFPKQDEFSIGGSIGCANMLTEKCICGKGKYCRTCLLNVLISEAVNKNIKITDKIIDKKVFCKDKEKNYRIKLNLTPLEGGLYCCVMDEITEILSKDVKYFNKKLNKDFERAKTIQSLMLPKKDTLKPLADFAFFYKQNYLVGGDLLDVYKFDDINYGGYIADVAGSGISAGMLTVYMHENYPKDVFSPAKALEVFAQKFNSLNLPDESYITALSFSVDTKNKKLYLCNAGHNTPAIIKKKNNAKTFFMPGNTVSNWYEGIDFNDECIDYQKGDMLILMTDGIPDLKNNDGEYYTFERAISVINEAEHNIIEILKSIEIDIIHFYKGIRPEDADDKALLIIELK